MGIKKARLHCLLTLIFPSLAGLGGLIVVSSLQGAVESKRLLAFHFDKIEARGALSIFVEPGKRNRQIEYFADSTIIDSVSAKVENRTLFLDANNSFLLSRRIPLLRLSAQRTFPVEVIVSIDELKEFRLLENSNARLNNLSANRLKLYHNSTGSLHLTNSKFEKIEIRQEGNGDTVLKGREVHELDAKIYGGGAIFGEELFLDQAVIRHYGNGPIMIAPSNWLDAQIFGSGNLHLLEKPLGKVLKNQGNGGKVIEEY